MMASKTIGLLTLTLGLGAMAYVAFTDDPSLPDDMANGVYWHSCCGSVRLADGVMTFGNRRIAYVIERDKEGVYLLPEYYVGVSTGGLIVESTKYPLKVRLDDGSHPQRLHMLDDGADTSAHDFTRAPLG